MYDLDAYVAHFRDAFRRRDQAAWVAVYLQGLLGDANRKTIGGLARRVELPPDLEVEDTAQALQNFVNQSPWDEAGVWRLYPQAHGGAAGGAGRRVRAGRSGLCQAGPAFGRRATAVQRSGAGSQDELPDRRRPLPRRRRRVLSAGPAPVPAAQVSLRSPHRLEAAPHAGEPPAGSGQRRHRAGVARPGAGQRDGQHGA